MKEENKKRINKLVVPLTLKSVSLLSAFTMITTGIAGCKKNDKNDTSSLNNDITTSDTSKVENNQTDTTTEIESNSTLEESSEIESNVSSSINSSKKPSTSNSQTTVQSIIESSNDNTSSSLTNIENAAKYDSLTKQNINDVNNFKKAANNIGIETRGGFGGNWAYYYNGQLYQKIGIPTDEFLYVLVGLNYEYLDNYTITTLLNSYSLEDLKRFNSIISCLAVKVESSNKTNNWNSLIIDNHILESLTKIEKAYLNYKNNIDKESLRKLIDGGMTNRNPIVRYYFNYICHDCFKNDYSENNKYNTLSADLHFEVKEEINQFTEILYNEVNGKSKVLS